MTIRKPARHLLGVLAVATMAVGLSACGGSDDPAPIQDGNGSAAPPTTVVPPVGTPPPVTPPTQDGPRVFELLITNATAGQPLSPGVVALHQPSVAMFRIGDPASEGLERLAEGAETDPLIGELQASDAVALAQATPGGPIPPGMSRTMRIEVPAGGDLRLSFATMLVNTNDALAAVNSLPVGSMSVGQTQTIGLSSYDSGTEANSEAGPAIPGPVSGGEGFNSARDDIRDAVHGHQGVVTSDDGLATSALTGIHRWDDPPALLSISRVE